MKEGDYVIISKPLINIYNVSGVISKVFQSFYEVSYVLDGINIATGSYADVKQTCAIYFKPNTIGECIELDVEYYRDLKLKELGI